MSPVDRWQHAGERVTGRGIVRSVTHYQSVMRNRGTERTVWRYALDVDGIAEPVVYSGVWRNVQVGDRVTIVATVKRFDFWNGKKSIRIFRAKLEREKPLATGTLFG